MFSPSNDNRQIEDWDINCQLKRKQENTDHFARVQKLVFLSAEHMNFHICVIYVNHSPAINGNVCSMAFLQDVKGVMSRLTQPKLVLLAN